MFIAQVKTESGLHKYAPPAGVAVSIKATHRQKENHDLSRNAHAGKSLGKY